MTYHNNKFDLVLRPSRYFFTLISGLHLILIFLVCLSSLDWIKFSVMLLIAIISYYYLIRKYIFRKNKFNKYIVKHLWQDDASVSIFKWKLKFINNNVVDAELNHNGFISDYLIIIHFTLKPKFNTLGVLAKLLKYRRKTVSVLIFPDMIDSKDYHRLKLLLTSV